MDALMLVVTGVALALAVGMSIVAVRLLRGERSRSAARVAALEAAAFDDVEYQEPERAPDRAAYRSPDRLQERVHERPSEDIRFREEEPEMDVAAAGAMFGATDEPKAPSRRWLALAAVAVVMAAFVGTIYAVFKPAAVGAASSVGAPGAASSVGAPGAPSSLMTATSGASTVSQAVQSRPIELLSLKHTIAGNTFSLVGLVVNPIDATPLNHVMAVVYLFDKDGAYFASGKAELEFSGLRPGEESPFTVKIPNVEHIGKYRVGFRHEDGSVIAHVDKRGQAAGSMTEGGGDR
jgi:hypothetical protein